MREVGRGTVVAGRKRLKEECREIESGGEKGGKQ